MSVHNHTIPTPTLHYFIDHGETSFGLPDGECVVEYRAYDATHAGPFRRPIGPLFGRVTAQEVRAWVAAWHPEMIEVEVAG